MRRLRTFALRRHALILAVAVTAFAAAPADAAIIHDFDFGTFGTQAGQFKQPTAVAINDDTGDIYVADSGNHRVQRLDSSGAFISMWGLNVDATNPSTGFEICTAASGNECQAGTKEGTSGAFATPGSVAVDDSGGPADGSVYVVDDENYRVQRFTADGEFVLMWGRQVNFTTGGNICTAASEDACTPGTVGGTLATNPLTPTQPGEFGNWLGNNYRHNIAVDGNGLVYVSDPWALSLPIEGHGCCTSFGQPPGQTGRIQIFNAFGTFIAQGVKRPLGLSGSIQRAGTVAVSADGQTIWVNGSQTFGEETIRRYSADDFSADGIAGEWDLTIPDRGIPAIDPSNQYLFTKGGADNCVDGATGSAIFEYHPSGEQVDCTVLSPPLGFGMHGYAVSVEHKMYLPERDAHKIRVYTTPQTEAPVVDKQQATEITSNKVRIRSDIAPRLGTTTFHLEYGPEPCSVNPCTETTESSSIGATLAPRPASADIVGLDPDTRYYYRVVATNEAGTGYGVDKSFRTFAESEFDPSCPNNLARQQTGAALLLDCRGYELVSAEDQGGYDVASTLIPGHQPFGGYPKAKDRALYAIHNGGVPGVGKPTNRGPDPYLAARDAANQRWNTEYVGIPADVPSLEPFSSKPSGTDAGLRALAFGGPDLCNPCFADGSAGVPIRLSDGTIAQGMAGSLAVAMPQPAGGVLKHFSADGTHFLFASEQQFEPAGNPDDGNVTIYDRDLDSGTTQVASTLPSGETIAAGTDVRALDVSDDGSRILIGVVVSTDPAGNDYYDLYMHNGGAPSTLDIVSGGSGALFNGMTADGSQVFFTSRDNLADDSDTSADLFRATIHGGVAIERVSSGEGAGNTDGCDPAGNSFNPDNWNSVAGGPTDCSVVAIGGGGGVAMEGGRVYFLSPEQLDGAGVDGAPNLFLAEPGNDPTLVETLESGANSPLPPPAPLFDRYHGSFSNPAGAAIDKQNGSFYVYDVDNSGLAELFGSPGASVQKFDATGNLDTTFDGDGTLDGFYADANGSSTGAAASVPSSIAVDNDPASANYGDLYVVQDSDEVRRFSSSGVLEDTIIAGGGIDIFTFSSLEMIVGVAVHPTNGHLYVAVWDIFFGSGTTVYEFDTDGNPIGTAAVGVGSQGIDVAVDSNGVVYFTTGTETRVYDSSGSFEGLLGSGSAYGVTVDVGNVGDPADDVVYIDQGNQVLAFDPSGYVASDPNGNQIGGPIGSGKIGGSVSLAADSSNLVVSNPDGDNVALFRGATAPNRAYDSPLVIESVRNADTKPAGHFQTTASGRHAVLSTVLPLTGFDNDGRYELFGFDSGQDAIACVSCNPTDVPPSSDATLPTSGLAISDDGRIFFNSGEPLILRDTNEKQDAYEWNSGDVELITTGQSPFDSGLLSVTADGTDAFFFTRETLARNDDNGNAMKLYTARENGGFFVIPPTPPCAASDECHGAGSPSPPPLSLGTLRGKGGNVSQSPQCDVKKLGQRAKRLSRRARNFRRRAKKLSGKRAAKARRSANKATRVAKRTRKQAKQCRRRAGHR